VLAVLASNEAKTAGLFNRIARMLEIIENFPDEVSDEELEGVLAFLPKNVAPAIGAVLTGRARKAGLSFLKMIASSILGAKRASECGKKVLLIPFNCPPEILHAFDSAHPITSEVLSTLGVVALEGQGERYWDIAMGLGLPDHLCSANTIELGSVLGGNDFKPDAIVQTAPGGCDVNSKIHEFVANYHKIPQFILEKPVDDSPKGRELYLKYNRTLISRLEEFLDEELKEDKLRAVMEKANRCAELYHDLWDLHKESPCPVPNLFSLFTYGTRFTMWGTDEGVRTMEAMVETARKRLEERAYPAPKEVARMLWVYTSYYFDIANLFNWMEEKGYTHLGDGLDLFFPEPVDTSSLDSMIEGIVNAAWNMPMTRQVGGEVMSVSWSDDVIYAARELKADCAVYCGHHACKQTWSVVSILRNELMDRLGIPLLTLQGDSWIRRITPVGVIQKELDDFIKNVVASKKRRGRRKIADRRDK